MEIVFLWESAGPGSRPGSVMIAAKQQALFNFRVPSENEEAGLCRTPSHHEMSSGSRGTSAVWWRKPSDGVTGRLF